MGKLIRHKWNKMDGFRRHQCEHCHCTRYWDHGFKRLMYMWGINIAYDAPECIGENGVPYN